MNRSGLLTAAALALALTAGPRSASAQFGGMMMGGGGGGQVLDHGAVERHLRKLINWQTYAREVTVETTGGRKVTGRLPLKYVCAVTDLGYYAVGPDKLKEVRFTPPAAGSVRLISAIGMPCPGVIVTDSGQEISGQVLVQDWAVDTEIGSLMLVPENLKSVTFTDEVRRPGEPAGGDSEPSNREEKPVDPPPPR